MYIDCIETMFLYAPNIGLIQEYTMYVAECVLGLRSSLGLARQRTVKTANAGGWMIPELSGCVTWSAHPAGPRPMGLYALFF